MGALIFLYTVRRNVKGNFTDREKYANDKNPYFDYQQSKGLLGLYFELCFLECKYSFNIFLFLDSLQSEVIYLFFELLSYKRKIHLKILYSVIWCLFVIDEVTSHIALKYLELLLVELHCVA